jgi:hypothetical protein
MNEPQARAIIEQVERDYAGRIRATLERSRSARPGAVRVALLLVAAQRRLSLRYPCQYRKALEAWQCFLLTEEEQQRLIQQQSIAATDQDEDNEQDREAS